MTSRKIYDWTYSSWEENNKINFKIDYPSKIQEQDTLFKFYSLSHNSVDAVCNRKLYFSHPNQFNDLYDCSENIILFDDDNFNDRFLRDYRIPKEKTVQFIATHLRELIYARWGVLCLTGDPNNKLMWAYYTNNEGFLVEFDWTKFPFQFHGPFPINYQADIHPLSMKEAGAAISILYQATIKHESWQKEKEWRILVEPPENHVWKNPYFTELNLASSIDRLLTYPSEALKSIALGNRFFLHKEITIISDNELELSLINSDTKELKRKLLAFIASNQTKCLFAQRHADLKSIHFTNGRIEQLEEDKFRYLCGNL